MLQEERKIYIERLTGQLPVLRREIGLSQQALADKAGLCRSSVAKMESGKQAISWNTFLSFLMIFKGNSETEKLLRVFDIYNEELEDFLSGKDSLEA